MNKIEKGQVVSITLNFDIDEDYTVYLNEVPVGTLKDDLTWFSQTAKPDVKSITEIVYLGDYKWGFKQLINQFDEFRSLPLSDQQDVISNYLHLRDEEEERRHSFLEEMNRQY